MHRLSIIGRCLLGLALLAVSLPTLAPPAAEARSRAWNPAQVVSQTDIGTYEPRVAYDAEGFAHTVYFAGRTQAEWSVYYVNNRNGAWSAPRKISDNDKVEQRAPNIAIGRDGRVHVVYEKRTRNNNEVYYVESPDLGKTWGTPLNLSNSSGRAYEPNVAVDASGAVHTVWIDSRWSGVLQTTYSLRPAGGAFQAPIKIGGNTFEQGPDITTVGTVAHVVYQGRRTGSNSTRDFDIYYATGAGGTFNQAVNFTRDSVWSLDASIASDGAGALMIAWDTDGNYHDVVAAVSLNGGQSWSPPRNLLSRSSPGLTPSLAYGLSNGQGHFHLAWAEGESGKRSVMYVAYNPARNEWGGDIETASDGTTLSVAVAASPVTNETAVTYRNSGLDIVVATRGVGAYIGAEFALEGYSGPTRQRSFTLKLSNPQGAPAELRYSFDAPPASQAPWQPYADSIQVSAPDIAECARTLYLQFRSVDGRVSQTFKRELTIDDEVQALVTVGNPAMRTLGGEPGYSRDGTVRVTVENQGECSTLSSLIVGGQPYPISNAGFSQDIPVGALGSRQTGSAPLEVRLVDSLGNELVVSQTITLDREAPTVLSGTLRIEGMSGPVPPAGLPSVLATLVFSDLVVSDTVYAGGFWGAQIANMAVSDGPGAQSDSGSGMLTWTPVQLPRPQNGVLVFRGWNVLTGLATSLTDRRYAGDEIMVLVRFVDGAGNTSERTLSATVRLAPDYKNREFFLPLTMRGGQ